MLDLRTHDPATAGFRTLGKATPGAVEFDGFDGHFFTHRAYLRARGFSDVLVSDGDGLPTLLYRGGDSRLVHLGRLYGLSKSDLVGHAQRVFANGPAKFIVFEDIRFHDDGCSSPCTLQKFTYQANWRRKIGDDEKLLSSKQASNLRRKQRKLTEFLNGTSPELSLRRCQPGDLTAIAALNRKKIEQTGRQYHLSDAKQAVMEEVASEIGYLAALRGGGEILAGSIVCVAGSRSYISVLGHDSRYDRFSPGMQLTHYVLSELARMGVRECNFLWGDSRWKSDFGGVREPLTTVVVLRNSAAMFSPAYWKAVRPYAVQAAKAALKPYVKSTFFTRMIRPRSD